MKDYIKVLSIINGAYKSNAALNGYVKLMYSTADLKLAQLLKGRVQAYYTDRAPFVDALRNYCEARLAEAKPAWQVEAEKHGWEPK